MINQTDIDLRHADYAARTAQINQKRWMLETWTIDGAQQRRGTGTSVGLIGQLEFLLAAIGKRLKGLIAGRAVTPAMTGPTAELSGYPASVRAAWANPPDHRKPTINPIAQRTMQLPMIRFRRTIRRDDGTHHRDLD